MGEVLKIFVLIRLTRPCVDIIVGRVRCIALHDMHMCMAARTSNSPVLELAEARF